MTDETVSITHTPSPGGAAKVMALHRAAYENMEPRFSGPPMDAFMLYVQETLEKADLDNHDTSRLWFAKVGGALAGCAALLSIENGKGQLRWVAVTPQARGAGLGRTLVTQAIDFAKSLGLSSIVLYTIDDLIPSQKLYQSLGFKVTESYSAELWYGKGTEVVMTLEL